jgi:hypothetical protein
MHGAHVTVGLPVRNGERTLPAAIATLLDQDWPDFTLLIADNASTDGTADIARAAERSDSRVLFLQQPENVGAVTNFNHLVELARGPFFAWAAHDDRRDPRYLRGCIEALLAQPDAVLAHSWVRRVDDDGAPIAEDAGRPSLVRDFLTYDTEPRRRFRDAIRDPHAPLCTYGVMRLDGLRRTTRLRPIVGGDVLFIAELALRAPFVEVPEELFTYRQTIDATPDARTRRLRRDLTSGDAPRGARFMRASMAAGLVGAIRRVRLPATTRAACMAEVAEWLLVDETAYPLARRALSGVTGGDPSAVLDRLHKRPLYRRIRGIDRTP